VKKLTRRDFLRLAGMGAASAIAAACAPAAPQIVEVEKPVVVEREVVKEVPVEKVVEVEKVVIKEVPVKPAPGPTLTLWAPKHFILAQNDYFTDSALLAAAKNNFEVDVQLFPWGEYGTKQSVAIEAGTMPDVFLGGMGFATQYVMGVQLDVSDLYAEISQEGGGFFSDREALVTFKGKQYGIPFHNEPQMMYYRTDIFGEAGFECPIMDADEFVEACVAVTDASARIWGFGNTFAEVPDGNTGFRMWVNAFGGRIQDEEGNIIINSPEAAAGVKFFCELYTKHKVMPPGATGWDDTGNNKAYLSGQCASVFNTASILNAMRDEDPGWLEATVFGPVPGPDRPATFNGGSIIHITATSQYPELGAMLIKGIMSPERYSGNMRSAGGFMFPTMRNAAEDPFFTEDPYNKSIAETLQYGIQDFEPGTPQAWFGAGVLSNMWAKTSTRVAVEGWTPEDALAEFEKACIEGKKQFEEMGLVI
jgi:multiple sugar transport system substrate-binding protein